MAPILLKNGTALIHDANDHVVPTQTSILIQGHKIAKIATNIEPSGDAEVIDCTDKIISPGFIDTHHHGWQTQLKGRHANELLLDYMVSGNAQSLQYSAKDAFYGYLSGMLEAVAAGTTTVVDHAHITMSPEHAKLAIAAIASSGIRSVYGYTPILRVKNFNPLAFHENPLEDWVMQTFNDLAKAGPFGNGRVTLGFACDLWFLPAPVLKGIFDQVKNAGVRTITVHDSRSLQMGGGWPKGVPRMLTELNLLDERTLLSHSNGATKEDVELIRAAGAHVSSTPSTELQMAMARPVCFDASFLGGGADGNSAGIQDRSSFGIDCHSNNAGSIIAEARLGLQNARNNHHEFYVKQGKTTWKLPESLSVEAAFNLATIKGAEAVRMENEIGRIEEGYKADLVIFDGLSPSMLGAAQHDPVAAIILHSSPADIETVIVDGIARKKDGRLLPIAVDKEATDAIGKQNLEWNEIAKEVVKSREVIQKELDKIDYDEGRRAIMGVYHVAETFFVES